MSDEKRLAAFALSVKRGLKALMVYGAQNEQRFAFMVQAWVDRCRDGAMASEEGE